MHTIEPALNGSCIARGRGEKLHPALLGHQRAGLAHRAAIPARPSQTTRHTFRCWLLRLGFIGDEFETARTHLFKRLPGNAAWRQAS